MCRNRTENTPPTVGRVQQAAKQVYGSLDACHDYASAALVEGGKEGAAIRALDTLLAQAYTSGSRS